MNEETKNIMLEEMNTIYRELHKFHKDTVRLYTERLITHEVYDERELIFRGKMKTYMEMKSIVLKAIR